MDTVMPSSKKGALHPIVPVILAERREQAVRLCQSGKCKNYTGIGEIVGAHPIPVEKWIKSWKKPVKWAYLMNMPLLSRCSISPATALIWTRMNIWIGLWSQIWTISRLDAQKEKWKNLQKHRWMMFLVIPVISPNDFMQKNLLYVS